MMNELLMATAWYLLFGRPDDDEDDDCEDWHEHSRRTGFCLEGQCYSCTGQRQDN